MYVHPITRSIVSRVIWLFSTLNPYTYTISKLQRERTEVLNKGGAIDFHRFHAYWSMFMDLHPIMRTIVSRVIWSFSCQNADTYAISELQRGCTEVLNKGGTNFWAPMAMFQFQRRWLLCLELSHHFSSKMLIRMPFRSSNEGEPKYSIRVVPTGVSLQYLPIPSDTKSRRSNEGDYCVSSYLTILAPKCWYVCHFWAPTKVNRSTQ